MCLQASKAVFDYWKEIQFDLREGITTSSFCTYDKQICRQIFARLPPDRGAKHYLAHQFPLMTVRDVFRKLWRVALKFLLWGLITSFIYLVICIWIMPPITLTQMVSFFQGYGLKRDYVSMDEISSNAKLAAMASEDQLFPDHGGFDWKSLEKSLQHNPKKRKKVRGAGSSTISQQVAKNVFLWQGSGIGKYIRKAPEVYFTKMIEWLWGKERILEVYLNVAEMGPGIFGIEAASQAYFKKPAKNLTATEAAMIIACLPNPKKFTVKPLSSRVKWRHRGVLRQMNYIQDDPDILKLIHTGSKPAKKK